MRGKTTLSRLREAARRSRSEPRSEREVFFQEEDTSPIVARVAPRHDATLPPQAEEGLGKRTP